MPQLGLFECGHAELGAPTVPPSTGWTVFQEPIDSWPGALSALSPASYIVNQEPKEIWTLPVASHSPRVLMNTSGKYIVLLGGFNGIIPRKRKIFLSVKLPSEVIINSYGTANTNTYSPEETITISNTANTCIYSPKVTRATDLKQIVLLGGSNGLLLRERVILTGGSKGLLARLKAIIYNIPPVSYGWKVKQKPDVYYFGDAPADWSVTVKPTLKYPGNKIPGWEVDQIPDVVYAGVAVYHDGYVVQTGTPVYWKVLTSDDRNFQVRAKPKVLWIAPDAEPIDCVTAPVTPEPSGGAPKNYVY